MANDAKFNFYLNRTGPRGQKGEKGDQGFSPSITVNTDTADEYTLLIQNEYDSFVTDNIRPTYDDRGGTYVRVDRANNVQYFGSADIATTADYGEVKLAQASDLASTVDVGNSNVITAELLKTWFDGQVADNLVTTTNNVTIQGQKIFATPTRFMDTVRIGNRLMVTQDDTGTITFDSDRTGTLIGTHLTSTGDASFSKNVTVDGIATIEGGLNVAGNAVISNPQLGNTTVSGGLTTKAGISIQGQDIHLRHVNPTAYLRNQYGTDEIEIFTGMFSAGNPNLAANYLAIGNRQLRLNLIGAKVLKNGKDVATADTVDAMQSDLNIAKQDIIEAQGDIDNLQMNKQNKLTAGQGIFIDQTTNTISSTTPITYLTRAQYDALETKDANTMYVITDEEGGGGGAGDIPIATTTTAGKVKPDGTTITITEDGTISAVESTTLQQETPFALNLTGNGTLGGSTPACTGSTYETGHPYYYAFKGATSSTPTNELWGPSSSAGNQYLILDCATPIALQSFRWTNGGNSQERFPTIVFKGSNDNSNYTTLGTYQTQNPSDDSVTIENYTPYRYYRFDFPTGANYGKLGFISMSGFNRYNILNIGDGLDVINGQLTCTATADAPITGVSAPLKLSGDTVYVPEMTGTVTDGFTVTASRFSSTYSSQYYKCFNADGNGWYAGNQGSGSDYIQIVFPRPLHLRGASIKQNNNTNSLVSNYALLITQNGTDWNEVILDKLPQTTNYETSKIINSNCLGFRFRADGNYEPNGAAISGITLDLTELPTTATLGYDDNFVLDSSNQLSLNSAKFSKLSRPILDVPVNNCVLAMPTAPTFDGTNVTVYTGTKVAIANGLNADGTCKSNIVTLTTDATINQSTFNGDVTLMLKSDGTIDQTAYSYFEVDDISTITTLTAYCWYYDRKTNNHYLASSEGAKQGPYQRIKIGSYNQATAATTKYFKIYKPIALGSNNEGVVSREEFDALVARVAALEASIKGVQSA